jgi:hypothetical protein
MLKLDGCLLGPSGRACSTYVRGLDCLRKISNYSLNLLGRATLGTRAISGRRKCTISNEIEILHESLWYLKLTFNFTFTAWSIVKNPGVRIQSRDWWWVLGGLLYRVLANGLQSLQAPPPPRQGHSAVWDEADSLIIMGGNNNDKIFGDVRILSLSTGYW